MNPGPVEEGEKVASGIVDALKRDPLVLALVVFNALFIVLSYVGIEHSRQNNLALVNHMIDQQEKFATMLYNCVPPNPK